MMVMAMITIVMIMAMMTIKMIMANMVATAIAVTDTPIPMPIKQTAVYSDGSLLRHPHESNRISKRYFVLQLAYYNHTCALKGSVCNAILLGHKCYMALGARSPVWASTLWL